MTFSFWVAFNKTHIDSVDWYRSWGYNFYGGSFKTISKKTRFSVFKYVVSQKKKQANTLNLVFHTFYIYLECSSER